MKLSGQASLVTMAAHCSSSTSGSDHAIDIVYGHGIVNRHGSHEECSPSNFTEDSEDDAKASNPRDFMAIFREQLCEILEVYQPHSFVFSHFLASSFSHNPSLLWNSLTKTLPIQRVRSSLDNWAICTRYILVLHKTLCTLSAPGEIIGFRISFGHPATDLILEKVPQTLQLSTTQRRKNPYYQLFLALYC